MKRHTFSFFVQWVLTVLGLWLAFRLLGTGYADRTLEAGVLGFAFAGLVITVVNTLVKPLLMIISLPFIILTLGLFTLIVNGFVVYLSLKLTPGFSMTFTHSIVTGIILSLLNYVVGMSLDMRRYKRSYSS